MNIGGAAGKGELVAIPTVTKACRECGVEMIKCGDGELWLTEKPVPVFLKDGTPVRGAKGKQAELWVEHKCGT